LSEPGLCEPLLNAVSRQGCGAAGCCLGRKRPSLNESSVVVAVSVYWLCTFASAPDLVYSGFFGVSGLGCTVDLVLGSCALVDRNGPTHRMLIRKKAE
jgi:hypothetical protein